MVLHGDTVNFYVASFNYGGDFIVSGSVYVYVFVMLFIGDTYFCSERCNCYKVISVYTYFYYLPTLRAEFCTPWRYAIMPDNVPTQCNIARSRNVSVTTNDRPFSCTIIYTGIYSHNAILFIDTSNNA